MKKQLLRIGTFIMVVFMLAISVVSVMAQTDSSAKTDLPGVINGLGLPKEQFDKTMKLTRDFLNELQTSNVELTKLMTPPASGAPADPKSAEKIAIVQRQFGIKLQQYHLDLADAIGDEKALKIIENIHGIVPQVLLQGSNIAASNHNSHGLPAGTNPNNAPVNNGINGKMQVPSNTMPGMNMPNTNNSQNMPGVNITENPSPNVNVSPNISMPNMNNTPAMNGNQSVNGSGSDAVNRQILAQLQSYNTMLVQMLMAISNQPNAGNLQTLIQPVYQLIYNQSVLIQMLYSNLNTGSMNTGSSNSGGMGMGMMGR